MAKKIPVTYIGSMSEVVFDNGVKLVRNKEVEIPEELAIEKCARAPKEFKLGSKATAEQKKAVQAHAADWKKLRDKEAKKAGKK